LFVRLLEGLADYKNWDSFLASFPSGHLLQSSKWGRLKEEFGWEASLIMVEEGGDIIAGAQVLLRPFLRFGSVAYVPKGPAVDFSNQKATEALLSAIHRLAKSKDAFFLKIEPEALKDPRLDALLRSYGFSPSPQTIQPRSSIVIDISMDLEEIMMRMKPKTRYNIKLSSKKGVIVKEGGKDEISAFHRLLEITGKRDKFSIRSKEYYETAYSLFAPLGLVKLLLAIYEGKVLAGLMAFAFGKKAYYLYGASSDEERHRMPNYLLQWEAIKWAKSLGCTTYDLGGVPDEEEEVLEREFLKKKGGLWGLYRFKRGWGGKVVRYIGAYDYVYSPHFYMLLQSGIKLKPLLGRFLRKM
jgi:lipid II:glycine glycyltransferase (peptidoglycan interpeptide bridge formation enzyme)